MKSRSWIARTGAVLFGILVCCTGTMAAQAMDMGPKSDVYMEVAERDIAPRLNVTVPTTYAFVVVGKTNSQVSISTDNKTLLLPNVTVTKKGTGNGYDVNIVGAGNLPFENYSTVTAEKDENGISNTDPGKRQGTKVSVNGYLKDTNTPSGGRAWKAVTEDDEVTGDAANIKNYRVALGTGSEYKFNKVLQERPDEIKLDKDIQLEKPVEKDGYDDTGLANTPSVLNLPLQVEVGGRQKDYTQTEESVKAGSIIWYVDLLQPYGGKE